MKYSGIQPVLFFVLGAILTPIPGAYSATVELEKTKEAAENGDQAAQYQVAGAFQRGEGVPRDDGRAADYYRRAAEQGHAKAQNNLAVMYLQGQGVKKDEKEAAKWFRKAAEQGAALAQDTLGMMYARGLGVPKDGLEAVKWYEKAAEQGLAEAQMHLGQLYYLGTDGVPQDYAAAAPWLAKAAERGNTWSQNTLGVMKENGEGIAENVKEAAELFRKAAEMGDPMGQFNYGRIHTVDTLGVARDAAQAYQWLTLSAAQGMGAAEALLKDFQKGMTPLQVAEGQRLVDEFRKHPSPATPNR